MKKQLNVKVKGLRMYFVQFYLKSNRAVDGRFLVCASSNDVAQVKVERMILTDDVYIPAEYDSWKVE